MRRFSFTQWGMRYAVGLGFLLTARIANAQGDPPEPTFPLPNVPINARLDAFMMKASHNTYERSHAYEDQLHDDNCWGLEFDFTWNHEDNTPSIRHDCIRLPTHTTRFDDTINAWFVDPRGQPSPTRERLTVIWLEPKTDPLHGDPDCVAPPENLVTHWSYARQVPQFVMVMIDQMVDRTNSVYNRVHEREVFTPRLLAANEYKWPSVRQLVDNGYHFIIVMQKAKANDVVFDVGSTQAECVASNQYNKVFINRQEGTRHEMEAPIAGDRYMWRSYPDNNDEGGWNSAIYNGFNIISTNRIGENDTFVDSPTLPSWPLYVDGDSQKREWERGTLITPFWTLEQAIDRIKKIRLAMLQPRPDTIPPGMEPHDVALYPNLTGYTLPSTHRTLNVPMRLTRKSGTIGIVRIQ